VNGAGTFLRVLEKYRLRWPVPPGVRAGIARARKETLQRIFRESGELSMGVRAALPLYRAARGLGIALTFRQGRMISSALAAMVFCVLTAGVFLVSWPLLSPTHPDRGVVVFAMGEVTRTGADGASTALKARDLLERGDTIKTGDNAAAIVQVGETIMVRLMARSELAADTLLDAPDSALSVPAGRVLARLERLTKNRSFSVKAPTAVASVRGTAFSVASGDIDTVVVADGTVSVKHVKTGDERPLGKGRAADSGTDLKERPATEVELLEIGRILRIPFVKQPATASPAEFDALAALVRTTDAEIDASLQKLRGDALPQNLQEIRARYGRIDVVFLYSGETIRGAVVGRGTALKMVVPGRYRVIPAGSVRQTGTE
jgi:hypothetical protein